MDNKSFVNLVNSRQACRDFSGEKVEKNTLYNICDLARFSPSACNSQPWKMYCTNDGEVFEKVKKALTYNGRNAFLEKAGGFICLVEKHPQLMADVSKLFGDDYFVKYDIGELIAYITLTAKSMGIESCIIGWMDKSVLKNALSLSENEDCSIVVALGYSNIPIRKKTRKLATETIKVL